MKIDRMSAIKSVSGIKPANRISGVEKGEQGAQTDKIAVSDSAQIFQNLLQKAKSLPDIREEKVNQVKSQIESGEFNLDSISIAESLLSPEKTEEK
jgi:negative regulator of flagellin synthesis FlgM